MFSASLVKYTRKLFFFYWFEILLYHVSNSDGPFLIFLFSPINLIVRIWCLSYAISIIMALF